MGFVLFLFLVRFWYCVDMVLVLCWYGLGMAQVRFGILLVWFCIVLVWFWYALGMVLVSISTSHYLANAILDPRVFINELGRPKADRASQTYAWVCNSEP